MKTPAATANVQYNTSRNILGPYADATYAFGRVRVMYVEYIDINDVLANSGSWPITAAYSAQLVEPSVLTVGKASWDMVRGTGEIAVEATRDLLDQVDNILRGMPQILAETGI